MPAAYTNLGNLFPIALCYCFSSHQAFDNQMKTSILLLHSQNDHINLLCGISYQFLA